MWRSNAARPCAMAKTRTRPQRCTFLRDARRRQRFPGLALHVLGTDIEPALLAREPFLERAEHRHLDGENDAHERQGVSENGADVEILEIDAELEADAVAAPQELDHEHDLPDERQSAARRQSSRSPPPPS